MCVEARMSEKAVMSEKLCVCCQKSFNVDGGLTETPDLCKTRKTNNKRGG